MNSITTTPTSGNFYGGRGRNRISSAARLRASNHQQDENLSIRPVTLRSGFHFQPGDRLDNQASFRTNLVQGNGTHDHNDLYDEENDDIGVLESPLSGSSSYNSRSFTPRTPVQSGPSSDVHILLQQQQSALLKVLQQQDTILEQQSQFGQRLDDIEQTVTLLSNNNNANTVGRRSRRVRLTRDLTVSEVIQKHIPQYSGGLPKVLNNGYGSFRLCCDYSIFLNFFF